LGIQASVDNRSKNGQFEASPPRYDRLLQLDLAKNSWSSAIKKTYACKCLFGIGNYINFSVGDLYTGKVLPQLILDFVQKQDA